MSHDGAPLGGVPGSPDPARVALVFRWSHQAFELLADLEQVTYACADQERYLRLLTLLREHLIAVTGRQYVTCRSADAGRAPLLVTPSRTRVLRSPKALDDPFPIEPPLMSEAEALVAEGLAARPMRMAREGAALPTVGELVGPMHRGLVVA
jgi:hypothetical protein